MSSPLKEPAFFFPLDKVQSELARWNLKVKSKNDLLAKYMLKGYKNEKLFGESWQEFAFVYNNIQKWYAKQIIVGVDL